ncbi:unnamed protein product [Schistosoma curassoni]|uniref:Reverse transcriptase domain-containing protein n=1 Tax=Schistosoma curassoni TaxID=6186 RepID=A0A183JPL2_9TREM|nr:unnamed protein product [Schistosoma curassoni]
MAEKAAREGNMRNMYDTTKKLAGNYHKPERPVKSKEGKVITNTEEQRNSLTEPKDLPIDVGLLTIQVISMAIRQIKRGKAAGSDNIPAEALKADISVTEKALHILFSKIRGEEQVPTDWEEGHLIKMPKKDDLSKCNKYRDITLLSIPVKVLNRVLLNRMKDSVDAQLRYQQAGFRKDRSCTDQIATPRIIVEQSIEWNSSLYSRSQHTQREKQDSPIQHSMQQSNHT